LSTPFTYDDGDNLPVVLEFHGGTWTLTDRGDAVARLGYDDEFSFTPALEEVARRVIAAGGHSLQADLVISNDYPDLPSVYDIADFVRTVAQVGALPALRERQSQLRFVEDAVKAVSDAVAPANQVLNWHPEEEDGALFKTDAKLVTEDGEDVYLWLVGDSSKAERSMTSALEYRRWGLEGRSMLGVRLDSLGATTRRRAVRVFNDDVVSIQPDDPGPLIERLGDLRIPLVA
ncbi:MAG TPA: DUF1828 domain-containing protein, partial [Microthrixaceae bacterium]|nr:DUF1828 domain-containing protein [Microthrixaceae bacterium]